jgi:hypothetical protein
VTAKVSRSSLESTSVALSSAVVSVTAYGPPYVPRESPAAVTVATGVGDDVRTGSSLIGRTLMPMWVVPVTPGVPVPPPPSATTTSKPSAYG